MRHKQVTAHAAGRNARTPGILGVCTRLLDLVKQIQHMDYYDSFPKVTIKGQVPRNSIEKMAYQEADVMGIFKHITKYVV